MDYWESVAARWDALLADGQSFVNHEEAFRRFHWFMKRALRVGRNTRTYRMLDLGCGTGEASWPLWRRVAHVTFFDRSPAMLRCARTKWPRGAFVRGDATLPPFLDAEFDVVVSRGALLSQIEPAKLPEYLQHVWRIMRPGAQFLFDFACNRRSLSAILDTRFHENADITPVFHGAWDKRGMTDLLRTHLPTAAVVAYDGTDRHAINRIIIRK